MHRNEVAVFRESLPLDDAIDICVNCPMKVFISRRAWPAACARWSKPSTLRLRGVIRWLKKNAPQEFVGKTLGELKVRSRFGVEVMLIHPRPSALQPRKNGGDALMPSVKYKIREGDVLVIFGENEKIAALERM